MSNFQCPTCDHHNVQIEGENYIARIFEDNFDKKKNLRIEEYICGACNKSFYHIAVWHYGMCQIRLSYPIKKDKSKDVLPMLPACVPNGIKNDFIEAYNIRNLSPKASATLARRCLQGMIRDFWGIKNKKNLYEEIQALKDKLDSPTWESIDAIRQMGNIGAHMEKDVNYIIDVDQKEANLMMLLIEDLIINWYARMDKSEKIKAEIVKIAEAKREAKITPNNVLE